MSVTTGSVGSLNEALTEAKLQKFYEEEEGDMIVMEFCKDLISNVMDVIQSNNLTNQAHKFVVKCAMEAMKKAIQINYCFHNVSHSDMGEDSWKPDEPCEPSQADSWAAYRVPVTYERESDDLFEDKGKEDEEVVLEEKKSSTNFKEIYTPQRQSISPTSSSQDVLSITDYLEDIISTSSDEDLNTSISEEVPFERFSDNSGKLSSKLSAKLSQLSGRSAYSDTMLEPRSSEQERYMSSAFSKSALGGDTGLCVPHIANQLINNVVTEALDVEDYTLVKVEKSKIKVSKKTTTTTLPRRRSDTKLKMANFIEPEPSKMKIREKRNNPMM